MPRSIYIHLLKIPVMHVLHLDILDSSTCRDFKAVLVIFNVTIFTKFDKVLRKFNMHMPSRFIDSS